MVAQTAPAVRVAIGEEAGLAPGSVTTGQMVAGLKRLGFDYVFDTGAFKCFLFYIDAFLVGKIYMQPLFPASLVGCTSYVNAAMNTSPPATWWRGSSGSVGTTCLKQVGNKLAV